MHWALHITPSIRSARASRVSVSHWRYSRNLGLQFCVEVKTHSHSSISLLHSHLSVYWSSPHPDLKVPLPWKTPLSPASPDSTTAPMARSPCPLLSASCPRTPPSPPPLELHPTCSTVTQVAGTAVHSGEHSPCHGKCLPFLQWTHPFPLTYLGELIRPVLLCATGAFLCVWVYVCVWMLN